MTAADVYAARVATVAAQAARLRAGRAHQLADRGAGVTGPGVVEQKYKVDDRTREALARDRTIDITTTTGRRSGAPRRKEIWFHNLDEALFITGTPGRRDWYASLLAHPDFAFHLKGSVVADLHARATPVTEPEERRRVLTRILDRLGRSADIEAWMTRSPPVSVSFDG